MTFIETPTINQIPPNHKHKKISGKKNPPSQNSPNDRQPDVTRRHASPSNRNDMSRFLRANDKLGAEPSDREGGIMNARVTGMLMRSVTSRVTPLVSSPSRLGLFSGFRLSDVRLVLSF